MYIEDQLSQFKDSIEEAILTGGSKGKESMIRSSYLINLIHDAVKYEFIDAGVKKDNIYPGLLTVIVTFLCWWLMAKKHVSAIWTMIILIGVALLGVLVGFFNPGLSY